MNDSFYNIIGHSKIMQRLFQLIEKVAEDDAGTVLIQGESGTGKELVAKAIHAHGPRRKKNFVPVNCAAIPDDLLESELFGHVKGAFTGAVATKEGRIKYADGGTLFLDEIGDMKPVLQAKLLRLLQERNFEPVGAVKPIPVDIRVIAATHGNLEKMVSRGLFREDLYYRLNVIPINIPPLRKRREDIKILLEHFMSIIEQKKNKTMPGFSDAAVKALITLPWHGNVRELENLVQHMTILHGDKTITLNDLPKKYHPAFNNHGGSIAHGDRSVRRPEQRHFFSNPIPAEQEQWPEEGINFKVLVNEFETELITKALRISRGNKKEAARILHLKRTTLLEKIKKKNIQNSWQTH